MIFGKIKKRRNFDFFLKKKCENNQFLIIFTPFFIFSFFFLKAPEPPKESTVGEDYEDDWIEEDDLK